MIDLPLPTDIQAERHTLGACLIDRDAIGAVRPMVSLGDFAIEQHAVIYEALLACYDRRIPPDLSTVTSELTRMGKLEFVGGVSFLAELAAEVPQAVHVPHYAQAVAEAGARRRFIEKAAEMQAEAYQAKRSPAELFEELMKVADVGRRASVPHAQWEHSVLPAPLLYRATFDPIAFTVDRILPPGTFLFVGKPKTKKSFTALGLAWAVASGGCAFGHFQAVKGDVLYIDLEMGDRRIHKRMHTFSPHEAPPSGLNFATSWPRVGEGGLEWLESYLERHPFTRLVIIDTMVAIRPVRPRDLEPYEADKRFAQTITDFCHKWPHLTMVLIHHSRKMLSGEPVDDSSGTLGLGGGVDNLASIERSTQEKDTAILKLQGRDIEWDEPITLRWEPQFTQWTVIDNAAALTPERRAIVDLLRRNPGLVSKQIAELLGRPDAGTRRLLSDMLQAEQIVNAQGRWFVDDPQRPLTA